MNRQNRIRSMDIIAKNGIVSARSSRRKKHMANRLMSSKTGKLDKIRSEQVLERNTNGSHIYQAQTVNLDDNVKNLIRENIENTVKVLQQGQNDKQSLRLSPSKTGGGEA